MPPVVQGDTTTDGNHCGPMATALSNCGVLCPTSGWYSSVTQSFHLDVPSVFRSSGSASLGDSIGYTRRGHVHGHLAVPTPLPTSTSHAWVRPGCHLCLHYTFDTFLLQLSALGLDLPLPKRPSMIMPVSWECVDTPLGHSTYTLLSRAHTVRICPSLHPGLLQINRLPASAPLPSDPATNQHSHKAGPRQHHNAPPL